MGMLTLFNRNKVEVLDVEPSDSYTGDGAVRGRQVALWRPPVLLSPDGRTMPGVSKELIAQYLVSSVSALAESDLGAVTVEWKEQVSRFATTTLTIHAWGQSVDILHPVSVVSQELADALEHYKAGLTEKVRELHKGRQEFGNANAAIRRAMRRVEELRDDRRPHYNDAEFLFIQANLSNALVLSALVPVSNLEPQDVFDN